MTKSENTETIAIESDSRPGTYYSVNTQQLTCTCPHFSAKLRGLALNDPHRLCKHIMQAFYTHGIPEHLKQYGYDSEWLVEYHSAFANREKNKKWDKNFPLPDGSIVTTKSLKKKKYCYIEGSGDGKKIIATLPLAGGLISYSINNFGGNYDLNTQANQVPWNYRYMEQAIIYWIVNEYNQTKNADAPIAISKTIIYKLNPDPILEGEIKTISSEKIEETEEFSIMFTGFIDDIQEDEEYYHVVGEVNSYKIDAYLSPNSTEIFYSINGSKTYLFDIKPHSKESTINLSKVGIESPVKLTITIDASDKFPKNFQFMEKALTKWLIDKYDKIKN